MTETIQAFVDKWSRSGGSERANKDSFLNDLCQALGLPQPDPATGDNDRDRYVFEKDSLMPHEGGAVTLGKMDLFKDGSPEHANLRGFGVSRHMLKTVKVPHKFAPLDLLAEPYDVAELVGEPKWCGDPTLDPGSRRPYVP
jgi:hypothetical protein